MKLIAISGKIGTGKTTLADHITCKMEYWVRVSFADILKKLCSEITKIPLGRFYQGKNRIYPMRANYEILGKKFTTPTPTMSAREILQWVGTDVVRRHHPNYWITSMSKKLRAFKDNNIPGVVIDDMRFPDEAGMVALERGYLVRLEPHKSWSCSKEIAEHTSETALDHFDEWNFKFAPALGNLEAVADLIVQQVEVRNV